MAGCDVGVGGLPGQRLRRPMELLLGHALEQRPHMGPMGTEVVGGVAGDANLVLAAELEAAGLLRDLGEQVEAVLVGARLVLDHGNELVDLRGEERHGGGEHGVELAEVPIAAGEVDREAVERVGVLGEMSEAESGVDGRGRVSGVARHVGVSARHAARGWGMWGSEKSFSRVGGDRIC